MSERRILCPFHSTMSNPRLFGPSHSCFTVYDEPARPAPADPAPRTDREEAP